MRRLSVLVLVILAVSGFCSCGRNSESSSSDSSSTEPSEQQINICILLDLSDRIEPRIHPASPEHFERDIAAIGTVIEFFRAQMRSRGAFFAKGKIKTIFSPAPASPQVNDIAASLRVDLSTTEPQEKKVVYDSLGVWYRRGLRSIYDSVIGSSRYAGADIWRFFAEGQVSDYCIDQDTNYDNILVILTDGYVYHESSVSRESNRTTYVTGPLLNREGLRSSADWSSMFEGSDYGLVRTPTVPGDLRVLVLEVNPSEANPDDYALLDAYWSKWFQEMNVSDFRLVKTDLPTNTEPVINRFLSRR